MSITDINNYFECISDFDQLKALCIVWRRGLYLICTCMCVYVCKETAVSSCSVESLLFAYPNYTSTLQTVVAIGTFSVGYKIHTCMYARGISKETSNSSYSRFIYDARSFQYVNCAHIRVPFIQILRCIIEKMTMNKFPINKFLFSDAETIC